MQGSYLQFNSKMEISNKKRTSTIRRFFNISMVVLLLGAVLLFVLDVAVWGWVIIGAAVLKIVVFQFISINYIYYSSEGSKILIRYYPIIAFFGKEYSSIEFEKSLLYFAKVKRVGVFSDLYLAIKTSKGIAEYPEFSLMGLNKNEIRRIEQDLNALLKKS